jgi:hypothetical protein
MEDPNKDRPCPAYVGGCGYPLCPFYRESSPSMECPFPIEGIPCQGHPVCRDKDFTNWFKRFNEV